MRELVEQDADAWIVPYKRMRDEAVEHIIYQGEIVATVPDLAARVKACELVLNRVLGMPRQSMALTGGDGGPVLLACSPASATSRLRLCWPRTTGSCREHASAPKAGAGRWSLWNASAPKGREARRLTPIKSSSTRPTKGAWHACRYPQAPRLSGIASPAQVLTMGSPGAPAFTSLRRSRLAWLSTRPTTRVMGL
jgi:hypothetical protein